MEVNSLAGVIYRIDPKKARGTEDPQTRVVILDARSGETFEKKPLLTIGKDIRFFRIMTKPKSIECRGPNCEISGPSFDERLELEMRYRARCKSGDERRLAAALGRGERPDQVLHELFHQWIENFVSERQEAGNDVYRDFHHLHADLERHLEQKGRQETGLTLKVSFHARGERQLPNILEIRLPDMDVHVRDSDESLKLSVDAKFEIMDKTVSLRRRIEQSELEEQVGDEVRRWIFEETNLHEFCYELRTKVRERITRHLDTTIAAPIGRRLSFIKLEGQALSWLPETTLRIESEIRCDIRESSEQVHVGHVIQLYLENLGKYRISNVDDLESWVREKLEITTRELFFEFTYRDLLRDFAPGERRGPKCIKDAMEEHALPVGYRIQQMTTIPDLKPIQWKDGILIELEKETFATRDPKVEVRMEIILSGKITQLFDPRLEHYLEPKAAERFEDEVIEKVVKEIRKHLHDMDPERVYMRFQHTEVRGEVSVKQLLEETAVAVLEDSFAFEDAYAVVKPVDTELTRRVEELMARTHQLRVEVHPFRGMGRREPVSLRLNYDIIGVHAEGWHVFRAKNLDNLIGEKEIHDLLCDDIQATLSTVPIEILQFVDRRGQLALLEILEKSTVKMISNIYGLMISLVNLHRDQTRAEVAENDKVASSIAEQKRLEIETRGKLVDSKLEAFASLQKGKLEELEALLENQKKLLKEGIDELNEEEYEKLKERINEINVEISNADEADHLKHLKDRSPSGFLVDEYEQRQLGPHGQQGAR